MMVAMADSMASATCFLVDFDLMFAAWPASWERCCLTSWIILSGGTMTVTSSVPMPRMAVSSSRAFFRRSLRCCCSNSSDMLYLCRRPEGRHFNPSPRRRRRH